MSKLGRRDRQKEATWRRRLRAQSASGQSVRAWCREHEVTENNFYWWRKELARRGVEKRVPVPREAEKPPASFVPVHVTEESARDIDPRIEIVLTDGWRVRVTGRVDRETLTDVLAVLSSVREGSCHSGTPKHRASCHSVEPERRAC